MFHWDDELERQVNLYLARKRREESHLEKLLQEKEMQVYQMGVLVESLKREKQVLEDRCQILALGQIFPAQELRQMRDLLEEAWLELALLASPRAGALSQLIRRLERLLEESPR
ncbi:hypothetical protein [Thermus caliditerrae]|uniref:hypothetical protein n=1 Tax=Thermus caliditerrae TaxID=1330700 RepID=UPI00056EED91|nr:hypothetical protein [Thermus caliditerrae]